MSDIQQTSENTLLWFIVAAIFGLLCLIIWLFQTVKFREPTVSDYYRNYNDEIVELINALKEFGAETIMMIEDIC